MLRTKSEWIGYFRSQLDLIMCNLLNNLQFAPKDKAKKINSKIKECSVEQLSYIERYSVQHNWDNEQILNEILTMYYASYVVMLEYRNRVWPYDYMAFSRRIGELWEPFCCLPFRYSLRNLSLVEPRNFRNVQRNIQRNATDYIDSLCVSNDIKEELKRFYAIPWTMVDSGGISLALDLHFEQNGIRYNCDFKSGFSSNEKGNTNRLLLVASVYRTIGNTERTILFVRQNEDENNHYFQILLHSPYWEVYCANDCYEVISNFTGFNLRQWLDNNVHWENDISIEFRNYLFERNLLRYLTW